MSPHLTAIIIVFIVIGLPIICITTFGLMLMLRSKNGSIRNTKSNNEETKIIQELYRGLEKMEKRIENLETLLLAKEKESKK